MRSKPGGTTADVVPARLAGAYFLGGRAMLDINLIRSNPEYVKEALKKREYDVDFTEMLAWDARRKELLMENENLKAERNRMNKEIPMLKKQGKDISEVLNTLKTMADRVKEMDEEQGALEEKINKFMLLRKR